MLNDLRERLRPTSTMRVYDAVSDSGIDVSDWHNISSGRSPAQNPNYCYRWAFEGNGRVLVCLWYGELDFQADSVEYKGNARAEFNTYDERANDQRAPSLKQRLKTWAARALQMDVVIKIAHWEDRLVRVALVQSKNPVRHDDERAAADFRLLDPEPWHLVQYNMQTGAFLLRRGPKPLHKTFEDIVALDEGIGDVAVTFAQALPEITSDSYGVGVADQFIENEPSERTAVSAFVWERSAKVRQVVLARSKGRCEHCGRLGFLKANGDLYVETHHIISLSESGSDRPENVIALCPEHHREAHYGAQSERLKAKFLEIISAGETCEVGA